MTTIAWRAGVIAADRQMGGWMSETKLLKLKDGSVLAAAGYFDDLHEVAAWLCAGAKKDARPDISRGDGQKNTDFIVACPDGKAYWLTDPWLRRVEIREDFYAIGTGAGIALGAMAAGASAKWAVEIACRFDENTGKGVNVIKVKK